jgi:14-3-3 protein epsilon
MDSGGTNGDPASTVPLLAAGLHSCPNEILLIVFQHLAPSFLLRFPSVCKTTTSDQGLCPVEAKTWRNALLVCRKWYVILWNPQVITALKARQKNHHVWLANFCYNAQLYDDMMKHIHAALNLRVPLSMHELTLGTAAFTYNLSNLRASWRIIFSLREKQDKEAGCPEYKKKLAHAYLNKIETELTSYCRMTIACADDLLARPYIYEVIENKIYCLKVKGHYLRYNTEVLTGEQQKEERDKARESYKEAYDLALTHLPPAHSLRLDLALTFSVFLFEMDQNPTEAISLAKGAFDAALASLDDLSEDEFKTTTRIMQLLRDNLQYWVPPDPTETHQVSQSTSIE